MREPGYYRHANVHKNMLVFVCEDDLWSVNTGGGIARRLTAGVSECSTPRLSPDGSMIAFIGRDEGHPEVYVMPTEGGIARRLTFLGAEICLVSGWTPDGSEILFCADAQSPFLRHTEIFAISPEGGMPRKLNLGHAISIAKNDKGTLIGRNSRDPAAWKRYRGGTAGEIWIDEDNKGSFKKLIDLPGNMASPMWLGNRVYFLCDHEGVGNIYSCNPDGSDLKAHTDEDEHYVRFPSTDGERIAFTVGGDVVLLDETGKINRVPVLAAAAPRQVVRKFVDGSERLEHYSINGKGDSVALISRGQPFTMPHWEEGAIQHGRGSIARYRHCEWLHDDQRFVVVTDENRKEQLEVHRADQSANPEVATNGDIGRIIDLATSPAGDIVAIANHRYELLVVDLKTKQANLIDRSPCNRITGVAWSPDGRWIAYTWSPFNDCDIIRIAEVATGKLHDVTNMVRKDFCPTFDPEGSYLYFLSNREFNPVYDTQQFELSFPQATKPYCIPLRKDVPSPFVAKPRPIVSNGEKRNEDEEKKPVKVDIDFDGISGRILAFPVDEGLYLQLVAGKKRVLFTQYPLKGIRRGFNWHSESNEGGTLKAYDFEEQRSDKLFDDVIDFRIGKDHQTLIYRSGKKLRVVNAGIALGGEKEKAEDKPGRKSGWIDLARVKVMIEPQKEWEQMLHETWRLQLEHFWDESMSQVDWDLVRRRYTKLIPRLRSRSDLSDLIWEMQGELGTSHAYEMGGDYRQPPPYHRGFLGAEYSFDEATKGYRIEKIIRGDSWDRDADSPLAEPGLGITEGDIIVAVGGRSTSGELSIDELLVNAASHDVVLTIKSPDGAIKRVSVHPLHEERSLRYRAWVEANRKHVHEKTNGRVGYLHIPDMGPWGFAEFHRGFLSELNREGLVVDVRYNRGGHVSALLLEKLARKRVGYDVSRWGTPQPYPSESVAGPMVAITNQFAGSDGDIFSHCFKLYKLGPLVGKRTWGGVIGIWPRHRLVDGTITTQPEFSFWFVDVGWKVENYGTDPDYDVDYAPHDYAAGRDPQMAKALQLVTDALRDKPFTMPDFSNRPALPLPNRKQLVK